MSDRPILFSAPMVRAILAGAKTQTRRVVTRATATCGSASWDWLRLDEACPTSTGAALLVPGDHPADPGDGAVHRVRPRISTGDWLWVRETFCPRYFDDGRPGYRADWRADVMAGIAPEPRWTPSIFMRRDDSRITLSVTSVRAERVHAISEADARAEGVGACGPAGDCSCDSARYARLWDDINGERAPWSSNPWVWVMSFVVVSARRAQRGAA